MQKQNKKNNVYYIDNKLFFEEMKKYKAACALAEIEGRRAPKIPNYIGECFFNIANKLSNRPNFINYSYKEEMIGDGIENCINYMNSFDPEKSNNPFAYFTQIVWHSFIHRIQKEKKQQYIKYKSMNNMIINNEHFVGETENFSITPESYENTQKFITTYESNIENNKKKKEEKKEKKALELFIEDKK